MKYWIFDKETMFLTSANVGDEYLGRNDYTAHIQGGAVAALQESLHTDKDFVSSCDIDLVRNSVAST